MLIMESRSSTVVGEASPCGRSSPRVSNSREVMASRPGRMG